jgi:molybdopterin-biosynthesis enzyme MoeA-like protein
MPNPTACLLIIGNEVLSGRTRDANLQFLATRLGEIGIPMKEVRVIPDVPEVIINTVNEVRAKFDHGRIQIHTYAHIYKYLGLGFS